MRSLWRTTIGLAAASVAMVTTLVSTSGGASAAPPPPPPPINELGLANLALTQMLTRGPDGVAVTAYASNTLPQVWDQIYQDQLPTQDGMSSPYLLRSHDTGLCLEDRGEGHHPVVAVGCDSGSAVASRQLWQIHRVADRSVNGRNYYYQINRTTGRVLTAQPDGEFSPVISAPAVPVSKGGAADHQLWVMLAA